MSDNKEGKNDGIPKDGKEALLTAGRLAIVMKMNERIMVLKLGASYGRRKQSYFIRERHTQGLYALCNT